MYFYLLNIVIFEKEFESLEKRIEEIIYINIIGIFLVMEFFVLV